MSWAAIVKSTKNGGEARYAPDVSIEVLERMVWKYGKPVTTGKPWIVMEFNGIIGAGDGIPSKWMRV